MKIRLCLLLTFFLFICKGQEISFKERKVQFPSKGYKYQEGDRYNPTTAAILSFLIPGVGQMYAGETGRGFSQLIPSLVLTGLTIAGISENNSTSNISCSGNTCESDGSGQGLIVLGLLGSLTMSIYSILDADSVAKVNSQYDKSKRSSTSSHQISIKPTTGLLLENKNYHPTLGFALNF